MSLAGWDTAGDSTDTGALCYSQAPERRGRPGDPGAQPGCGRVCSRATNIPRLSRGAADGAPSTNWNTGLRVLASTACWVLGGGDKERVGHVPDKERMFYPLKVTRYNWVSNKFCQASERVPSQCHANQCLASRKAVTAKTVLTTHVPAVSSPRVPCVQFP